MASLMVPGVVLILLLDSLQAETEDETRSSKDADHIRSDTHVLLGTCGGWGRDMHYRSGSVDREEDRRAQNCQKPQS